MTSPSSIFTLSAARSLRLDLEQACRRHGEGRTYQDGHSRLKRREVRHLRKLLLDYNCFSMNAVDSVLGGRSGSLLRRSAQNKEKRVIGLDYICWLCLRRIK